MLKVAVGVIKNQRGEVLISKRANDSHQGGLWEFPGGKLEVGENTTKALKRELLEELNISVLRAVPLIQIKHHYGDVSVCLDVHTVENFQGDARGMEGQPVKWVAISELKNYSFPAANAAIIEALNLPHYYPIVDESIGDEKEMLSHLESLILRGYTMVQLRAKSLNKADFKRLAEQAMKVCKQSGVRLFVNTHINEALELNAEAIHLGVNEMMEMEKMPSLPDGILFAASCHNQQELNVANDLGVLFAVLSPVCKTQTHVGIKPLGWEQFGRLVGTSLLPVFALGGIGPEDIGRAQSKGAYGVAGIRAF
ncbi:MAG: Nudix family hydrolase [Cycloclasticus sp.]|nr:Nudix family hydrolase [Cycloclasticus sp.]